MLSKENCDAGVDIKKVLSNLFIDEADMDTITSFIQEAMIIKDLKHPNIIKLVGVVLQRAAPPFIVTPLTKNGDLAHFLKISRATSARLQVRTILG